MTEEQLATPEPEFINGTTGEDPSPEPERVAPEPQEGDQDGKDEVVAADGVTKEETPSEDIERPKQTPWFQRRIDELVARGNEAQQRAERLEAQIARLQQPQEGAQSQGDKPLTQADVDRIATEKAQQIAHQTEFNRACNDIYEQGAKSFEDFDASLSNFRMLGGLPPALVEAAIETGEPHKVLYELGKNPDEASRIMALSPIRMGAAAARIAAKQAPAAPAPVVSKAPAPIRPIAGSGKVELDDSRLSMAEWEKKHPLPARH
jgi:hypothetical protein